MTALKLDAGVDEALWGPAIQPKVFKALLTMDAYVFVGNGTPAVRTVQRWLNATYVHRLNFFIIPSKRACFLKMTETSTTAMLWPRGFCPNAGATAAEAMKTATIVAHRQESFT